MKIYFDNIKSDTNPLGFDSVAFNEYLFSLGLNSLLTITKSICEDTIVFEIIKVVDSIVMNCKTLKIQKRFLIESPTNCLWNAILQCCGLKKTIFKGLSVRDPNGFKFKPEIEVFSFQTLLFSLPDELWFSKDKTNSQILSESAELFFNNEILSSILSDTDLLFRDKDTKFNVYRERDKVFVKYTKILPNSSLDHLLDFTIQKELQEHLEIAKKYPVFNNFLNNHIENLVFSKKGYKALLTDTAEIDNLIDFIENIPLFQDKRDDIVNDLKGAILENFPPEKVQKYKYLEVFKCKQPKNKHKFSLKNFENS